MTETGGLSRATAKGLSTEFPGETIINRRVWRLEDIKCPFTSMSVSLADGSPAL
jgi:hypothetical protein